MCCGASCCHQRSLHDIKCRCCCDRCVKCDVCAGEDVEDYAGDILTTAVVSHLAGQIFRPKAPSRKNPFLNFPRERSERRSRRTAEELRNTQEPEKTPFAPFAYPSGSASAFSVSGVTTTSIQRTDTSFLESLACSEASLDTTATLYPDSGYVSRRSLGNTEEEEEHEDDEGEEKEEEGEEEEYEESEQEEVDVRHDVPSSWSDEDSEEEEEPPAPSYSTGLIWSVHNACAHQ